MLKCNNLPKKLTIFVIGSIIMFSMVTCVFATDAVYVWASNSQTVETVTTDTTNSLELTCGGAILIEQNTGKVLYDYNSHERLRPASVTKVMSLLLIMEAVDSGKINLTDKVSCSEIARSMGGSQIWLDETEELTVEEMLKAICVVSANDCVVAMAEYISGSENAFVEKMNSKAKELGMNDTTFKNCHGIDEEGHLTSAYDISLMSRELMLNHPNITNYTTIWMDSLRDGKSELVNTNKLIRTYSGATGLKTGSTSLALFNLSATATKNDLSLIAVIMKAETSKIRFAEAKKLLDYGFSNFSYSTFANSGEIAGNVTVEKGIENNINAVYLKDAGCLLSKGQENGIDKNIVLSDVVVAPINKGDIIGTATYKLNNEILCTVDIVAEKDVKRINILNITKLVYKKWATILK